MVGVGSVLLSLLDVRGIPAKEGFPEIGLSVVGPCWSLKFFYSFPHGHN
jgi:hypothetical protein